MRKFLFFQKTRNTHNKKDSKKSKLLPFTSTTYPQHHNAYYNNTTTTLLPSSSRRTSLNTTKLLSSTTWWRYSLHKFKSYSGIITLMVIVLFCCTTLQYSSRHRHFNSLVSSKINTQVMTKSFQKNNKIHIPDDYRINIHAASSSLLFNRGSSSSSNTYSTKGIFHHPTKADLFFNFPLGRDYGGLKLNFLSQDDNDNKVDTTSTSSTTTISNNNIEYHSNDMTHNNNTTPHHTSRPFYLRKIHNDSLFNQNQIAWDDENSWDNYYAFDDDVNRNEPFIKWIKDKKSISCRYTSWHKMYHPNCNSIHELEIVSIHHHEQQNGGGGGGDSNKYLGSGFYRDVFRIHNEGLGDTVALKTQRMKRNPWEIDRYEFIRMDALVMERLSASPRIVDIFGHCGTSMLSEYLSVEAEDIIIPGEGVPDSEDGLQDQDDVKPQNDLTNQQKLEMALQMAEALADLHGFKDGVIVHDDIQLPQFLISNGKIKLNDFNRAEVMLFDEKRGKYCKYRNGKGGGDYRAPEEYKNDVLDEKIDVWSMGNNIYALLTGLWVFYEVEDDKEKQKMMVNGAIAHIDPRYRTRSYAEGKMVEIMERCWIYDPDKRADIFEVVASLKEAVEVNKRLMAQSSS